MATQELALRRPPTLIVTESGTPLLGISGHPVSTLEKSAQVLVHGELGAYTVVSYEGRNGYVLSERLADPSSLVRPEQPGTTVNDSRRSSLQIGAALLSAMAVTAMLIVGAVLTRI